MLRGRYNREKHNYVLLYRKLKFLWALLFSPIRIGFIIYIIDPFGPRNNEPCSALVSSKC